MTVVLGIETSCDETSAAVVVDGVEVRSNVVASQVDLHRKYGGVVPEIASRAHIERLDAVIEEALTSAACQREEVDVIAVTTGPGLVGALLIGVTAAKTLSWLWGKPLVAVDHIQAHAYSGAMGLPLSTEQNQSIWPAVALVVSGGHTSLFLVHDPLTIERMGSTTDDAAGEAFDKVASILGLGYPGGPQIDKAARQGDAHAIDFPRTMLDPDSLDFSFSGIKTAVLYHVNGPGKTSGGLEKMSPRDISDVAASFQHAVVDVLVRKTMLAARKTAVKAVVLGGGVAANSLLRNTLAEACKAKHVEFHAAKMAYCTDNAAMIAALGYHQFVAGKVVGLDVDAQATGSR